MAKEFKKQPGEKLSFKPSEMVGGRPDGKKNNKTEARAIIIPPTIVRWYTCTPQLVEAIQIVLHKEHQSWLERGEENTDPSVIEFAPTASSMCTHALKLCTDDGISKLMNLSYWDIKERAAAVNDPACNAMLHTMVPVTELIKINPLRPSFHLRIDEDIVAGFRQKALEYGVGTSLLMQIFLAKIIALNSAKYYYLGKTINTLNDTIANWDSWISLRANCLASISSTIKTLE